jgi:hypothetical protein
MKALKYLSGIVTIVLLFLSTTAIAQPDPVLPAEQVTILKNFEAQLAEAERIDVMPELPTPDSIRKSQYYQIPTKSLGLSYPPPKIRPLGMRREKVEDAYKGFLKLGAGYPTSLFAEGNFNTVLDKKLHMGVNLNHHSANFSNDEISNQRFSLTEIDGEGTYYHDQGFAVNVGMGYSVDQVHFYGYNFDDDLAGRNIEREEVQQQFNIFDFGASIFNGVQNVGDINYKAGFDFYLLNDEFASSERGFVLNLQGTKWINKVHSLDIVLSTDFTTFEDTSKQSLNNFYLQPSFTYHNESVKVKIGGNVVSNDDEFSLFPDIQATVNVLGSSLAAYAGAEGTLQKNTFRSLSDYNPFISSRIQIANTVVNHYYGGVKGNLPFIDYSVEAGYQTSDDLALFLQMEEPEGNVRKRFDILYDTVSIVNINGSLATRVIDGLTVSASVNQNFFSTTVQEKAWHLPATTVNGTVEYLTLRDMLRLKAELFIENGVPYLNEDGKADNLNGLFDISLGADFFFSKNFGAFIQVNNLANNKRQRWEDYPTFGINLLVGASARF